MPELAASTWAAYKATRAQQSGQSRQPEYLSYVRHAQFRGKRWPGLCAEWDLCHEHQDQQRGGNGASNAEIVMQGQVNAHRQVDQLHHFLHIEGTMSKAGALTCS